SGGLTKFGTGALTLTASNPNFSGQVTLNSGTLTLDNTVSGIGSPVAGVINGQNIVVSGGTLVLNGYVGTDTLAGPLQAVVAQTGSTFAGSVTVTADSTVEGSGAFYQHIASLDLSVPTLNSPGTDPNNPSNTNFMTGTPLDVAMNAIAVDGAVTLGQTNTNISANASTMLETEFNGVVSGGELSKYGNGWLLLNNPANTYSGGTVINGSTAAGYSVLTTTATSGTPYGTGPITINPGGELRMVAPAANYTNFPTVTLSSDGASIAGIGVAYNGPLPSFASSTTGPYGGYIALDAGLYNQPLDMATIGNGTFFLGSSITASNGLETFAGVLTPGAPDTVGGPNVYRLGAGGGTLAIGANDVTGGATGLVANVLTGDNNVQIGAITGSLQAESVAMAGGAGLVLLYTPNDISGTISVNNNSTLGIYNSLALGTATLEPDGGTIIANGGNTYIPNNLALLSDMVVTTSNDLVIAGNVAMSAVAGVGASRTFTVTPNASTTGEMVIDGIVSGVDGSSLTKAGTGTLVLNGLNTFQGTTTITAGNLLVGTNVALNVAGALGISDTPIILNGGTLGLAGQITVSRDLATSAASGILGDQLTTSIITGGISNNNDLTIAQTTGGTLDIQGGISDTGTLTIGTTATTAYQPEGRVVLSSNSNGYSLNTFSGGVTLNTARLVISSNANFSGSFDNPTTISSPLGTGSLTFGAGVSNTGGIIETDGADRVIMNQLGALTTAASTTLGFAGNGSMLFTSGMDLNGYTAIETRTFNVATNPGTVTFNSALINSNDPGVNVTKTGLGTLVFSGDNSYLGTTTISAGTLSVSSDSNLGNVNDNLTIGANTPSTANLQVTGSFTTDRGITLSGTGGGAIDVTGGNTLTVLTPIIGGQSLNKVDSGTLLLVNSGNNITNLTISGGGTLESDAPGTLSGNLATSSITINGGTLAINPSSGIAIYNHPATLTYNAGSYISLTDNPGSITQLSIGTLTQGGSGTGTLVIVPGNGNLGATGTTAELLTVSGTAPTNVAGVGIVAPYIVAQTSGTDSTAGFVTYDQVHGFVAAAPELAASDFSNSDPTQVVTIGSGLPQLIGANLVDAYALATGSDITGTGTLRLDGGGLILNGGATQSVTPNLYFGTTAGPGTGYVYVAGGLAGPENLSGSITASELVKFGPGDLTLSGTNNWITGAANAQNLMIVDQGTLSFGSQASMPVQATALDGAQYVGLTLNDTGTLDLNGQGLAVGGLLSTQPIAGLGTVTSGVVSNNAASGGVQTLTLNVNNVTDSFAGVIQDGSQGLALVKSGTGTQALLGRSTYSGGTTIDAGTVVSNGVPYLGGTTSTNVLSTGVLQVNDLLGLGTGQSVTLNGGTLAMKWDAANLTDVLNGLNVAQFGPGGGYNLTVSPSFTLDVAGVTTTYANDSSTIDVNNISAGTSLQLMVNDLTMDGPQLNITGGNSYGLYVAGTTTLAGDTTFNTATGNLVLAGGIAGAGDTITKIGAGVLYVIAAPGVANNMAGVQVDQGTLQAEMFQGGSNPLGTGALTISGGATVNVRNDGDGTSSSQVLNWGNDINIGTDSMQTAPVGIVNVASLTTYGPSGATVANKTMAFGDVTIGGVMNSAEFEVTGANGDSLQINNLTMSNSGEIYTASANLTIQGTVNGPSTLYKTGNNSLYINSANSYAGGTVLQGGTTYFGQYQGVLFTPSNTATLGAGNIMVNSGAAIQFNSLGNLNGDQTVEVRSSFASMGMLRLAVDADPAQLNLRSDTSGGNSSLNSGAGVLAIDTNLHVNLNQSAFGDGTWYFGSTNSGTGL
ncbi:MAG TPA: autotransporter-associated beta strand repeat-containing protein, partial [Pirellulales bacterium]